MPLSALTEVRHRVSETRYRIPDVAVYLGGEPDDEVPSHPPFITVEIISPDDRFSSILGKLIEYAEWGVKHIWLVDPQQRKLSVYEDGALRNVDAFRISEFEVTIPLSAILPEPPASDTLKS
ncbi:MAG: Uma2 family endonuclease [Bryobacterales bacterium]|nr:Uma2 family endonuclease [Bryobacterales bacterium]